MFRLAAYRTWKVSSASAAAENNKTVAESAKRRWFMKGLLHLMIGLERDKINSPNGLAKRLNVAAVLRAASNDLQLSYKLLNLLNESSGFYGSCNPLADIAPACTAS